MCFRSARLGAELLLAGARARRVCYSNLSNKYQSSLAATAQLTKSIFYIGSAHNIEQKAQEKIMNEVKHKKTKLYEEQHKTIKKESRKTIKKESSASATYIIELASEKGALC